MMERTFNFAEAMKPIWDDGGIAYCESVAKVETAPGEALIPLYYHADEILSVQSADLLTTYTEGKDYVLENGCLRILKDGAISCLTLDEAYPKVEGERTYRGRNGIAYLLFSEGTFFHERQLAVTYRHSDAWRGPIPAEKTQVLPKLAEKLRNKTPFTFLIYGDSITAGGNASACTGIAPYLPRFGELFAEHLSAQTGTEINVVNTAVGGMDARWGRDNAEERVAAYKPDLVLIGFGMNDGSGHCGQEEFADRIRAIIETTRKTNPDCEFILVTSISANPEVCLFGTQAECAEGMRSLAGEGIAIADMMPIHTELLKTKRYIDMTGNNVNHPNDYLHRTYAQVVYALMP
ncbi:MAG: SGNH/GDSL hydrolase family protein [Clostridia bacterium]|nr:SGNH/GDSL hydrolase family protein [Clostridia bacterium]